MIERHTSPDGLLQLVVDRDETGDWLVGFDGFQWHTHGDLLSPYYGGTPDAAVRAFVDELLASRIVIVVSRVDEKVRDAWVSIIDDSDDAAYVAAHETVEKRLWNGQRV